MIRFTEDALRVMRAVRFYSQLGFKLDPATSEAVLECREKLSLVSAERLQTELDKMLVGQAAGRGLALFLSSGLAGTRCRVRDKGSENYVDVLPELVHLPALPQNIRFHCYNVWEHILAAVDNSPRNIIFITDGQILETELF